MEQHAEAAGRLTMRMRQQKALALALLTTLVLAGCVGGDRFEAASARGTPPDAPSEAGRGDHLLVVRVTDGPKGAPLEDAAVAVSWRDGSALGLRTDAQGLAQAHVPAEEGIYISAYLDGYTEERLERVPSGGAGATSTQTLALYRHIIETHIEGTLSPADASAHRLGAGEFKWYPQEVAWGETPDARAGYMRRLVAVNATLTWTNGPAGGGDLAVALGAHEGYPDVMADSGQHQVAPGTYVEEILQGYGHVHENGWNDARTFYAGPGTATGYVAPTGLGYSLHVRAEFEGEQERDSGTPAPALPLLVGALALGALVWRRGG